MVSKTVSLILFTLFLCSNGSKGETNAIKKSVLLSNDLGLNLVQSLQQNDDQNVVLSPFALQKALILLNNGSKGKTKQELNQVLGIQNNSEDEVKNLFKEEKEVFEKIFSEDSELVVLTRVLINRKGIQSLRETFKRAVKQELLSSDDVIVQSVDFETNNKDITLKANQWLNNATRGRQTRFFQDPLDPQSSMVLLSAVDFSSAKPQKPLFRTEERKEFQNFVTYTLPLMKQMVPYLQSRDSYRLLSDLELKSDLLEIPFNNNRSLFIVQPRDSESLQYMNENMTSAQLNRAFDDVMKATPTLMKLFLPKLKLEFDFDFKELFEESFDLKTLFTSAEFNDDFRPSNTTSGDSRVSTSVHKTSLELNESQRNDVSSDDAISVNDVKEFVIEKPFLLALRENSEKVLLLLGKINHLVDEEALGLGLI